MQINFSNSALSGLMHGTLSPQTARPTSAPVQGTVPESAVSRYAESVMHPLSSQSGNIGISVLDSSSMTVGTYSLPAGLAIFIKPTAEQTNYLPLAWKVIEGGR